ncbi:hypothetical protein OF83DRAFT_1174703 [Amylostereum chailletii]|nr:hypothetical protein OF83DRAFT_1174703 [Amylostereum chailletii]
MATNVKADMQTGPLPGVLGRARLLDWIGSSFSTLDADGHEVVYLVEDGGTTVSKGPFFLLHHRNKGLDVPNLRDDKLE